MASTPASTASRASSSVTIPLRTSGSGVRDRSHATSSQSSEGSIRSTKKEKRADPSAVGKPAPARLAKPIPGGSENRFR